MIERFKDDTALNYALKSPMRAEAMVDTAIDNDRTLHETAAEVLKDRESARRELKRLHYNWIPLLRGYKDASGPKWEAERGKRAEVLRQWEEQIKKYREHDTEAWKRNAQKFEDDRRVMIEFLANFFTEQSLR